MKRHSFKWLFCGDEVFPALFAALKNAQKSIRLEIYIYGNDELGQKFATALIEALGRGVRVQVLVDAMGSLSLNSSFWEPLIAAGGEVRWFNPILSKNFGVRDHRKMLVCDEEVAFIGGFNIAKEYQGDGVTNGWCDLGLQLVSPLAVQLAAAFDEMFAHAGDEDQRFQRHADFSLKRNVTINEGKLLLSGPGRGSNPFVRSFREDLKQASSVQIMAAYFLPSMRIRRQLRKLAREGVKVQLLFPGVSDILLSQLACRSLYRRLLKAGVEIYEYQPQILHAKMILLDDVVYAGSSNLDPRSLYINYELMVRFKNKDLVAEAAEIFARNLKHAKRIDLEEWKKSRNWWNKLQQRWAYFLLVRVDPLIAKWHFHRPRRRHLAKAIK